MNVNEDGNDAVLRAYIKRLDALNREYEGKLTTITAIAHLHEDGQAYAGTVMFGQGHICVMLLRLLQMAISDKSNPFELIMGMMLSKEVEGATPEYFDPTDTSSPDITSSMLDLINNIDKENDHGKN